MVLTSKRSGHNDRRADRPRGQDLLRFGHRQRAGHSDLLRSQKESFEWFTTEGLAEVFRECSPIVAGITRRFASGESARRAERYELYFQNHWFDPPLFSPEECREREITYARPLYVKAQLRDQETGEVSESDIFFGDMPMMTETGTFVINGAERVLVSQLQRAPSVYYEREPAQDPACPECGRLENWYYRARISASRGARIELSTWTPLLRPPPQPAGDGERQRGSPAPDRGFHFSLRAGHCQRRGNAGSF